MGPNRVTGATTDNEGLAVTVELGAAQVRVTDWTLNRLWHTLSQRLL